jgi:hydroxyacylglutathione hydrolase
VLFRQFVDDGLGCASYLIGDDSVGEAVIVDPAYAIEQYLEVAAHAEVRITRVVETHTHADHVSGHGRLALEHGVPVSIHPAAEPEYPFDSLEDGQELELGEVVLRVVHTPGHRPEHCALTVTDRSRGDEPWLVLTGDSLFVGDAARPDLAVEAREGAEGLFHSLRRLAELPDGVEIYPGHVAGSLCGAGMSSKPSSTIGFERRFNHALGIATADEFVADQMGKRAPRPPNMDRIVELNRGPFLGAPSELKRLDDPGDATLLDVRDERQFAGGHAAGAFNVPLSGSSFGTKAGFVLLGDERIAVQAASVEDAERAARGLRSVGLLDLAGYVLDAPTPESFDPVDLEELEGLLERGEVEVLDVREPDERAAGYIGGSRHIPYRLLRAYQDDLPTDRPVVTICSSGARAAIAASVLEAAGVEARPVLGAGVSDWEARGGHTVEFRRCGST